MDLVKHYRDKTSSDLPDSTIERRIASLLDYGLTEEQIFFSINYMSKYKPARLNYNILAIREDWKEIERYYNYAKVKRATETLSKDGEKTYDQRNTSKRADTPSWFRKSFDSDLFK